MRLNRYEEFEDPAGRRVRYRRRDTGGVVAVGAEVAQDATLGRETWVDPGARVVAGARIGSHGWVEAGAVVGEQARLGRDVHVGRDAVVGAGAWVGDRTHIGARAHLAAGVALEPDTRVPEDQDVVVAPTTPSVPAKVRRGRAA
ncbi:transferase [Actinotalea sp. C106]|uniref:transferase n=1 Tax=Actinotalea sp. C106 TaxID=2908644 RepID=UPI0020291E6B|nr:transferase [Actinotalea sp. C106]